MTVKQSGALIEMLKKGEDAATRHYNPYLLEALELENILYTGEELIAKFPSLFQENEKPIVLEIGCYMGKTIMELADFNPHLNLLGVDITYKRTVKAARKIKSDNKGNARIGICDAMSLLSNIPDFSLTGVCVFFPDPWPKKRHRKNRLMNEAFFKILAHKISQDGFFWLKTDHEEYFHSALEAALNCGFSVEPGKEQPSLIEKGPYITIFEKMFLEKQLPTHRCILTPPQRVLNRASTPSTAVLSNSSDV